MKQTWYLLGLLLVIAALWSFPVIYPLKLLVVFFHESSHALATVLTGGQVQEMVVSALAGGHVVSLGGNRFVTLSAGYLGSLLWGVLIYVAATGTRFDRAFMALLGVTVGCITIFYVKNLFALVFGIATAAGMLICARFLNEKINDFLLRLVGLTSMIYVPLDIVSDTILRSYLRSDARMLAEEIGGTTIFWGVIWIVLSLFIIFRCVKWSLRVTQKSSSPKSINPDSDLA